MSDDELMPDYGAAVEAVGGWIAAGTGLEIGATAFMEVVLPESPDAIVSVFETGGDWDRRRGLQAWTLLLVARAAYLSDARILMRRSIIAALQGWAEAEEENRAGILDLSLTGLPKLAARDDRTRVHLEALFSMEIHAPVVPALGLEA